LAEQHGYRCTTAVESAIGNSIHAGMVIVCDGTEETDAKLERVLKLRPAMGLLRHADAGYETAREEAAKHRLHIQ